MLAVDLIAWTQHLLLHGHLAKAEPKSPAPGEMCRIDLAGATITGLPTDLTGLKAHGLRRPKGDFTGFVLDGADFSSATLDRAMFTGATLRAHGTTPATFDEDRLMGASFTEAVLDQTRFTDAALGGVSQSTAAADFSYTFLGNCSFAGANLYGVLFVGATPLSGNLDGGGRLRRRIPGRRRPDPGEPEGGEVRLRLHGRGRAARADLTPSGAKPASLASAFLQAADFTGTKLDGANLVGAAITDVRGQVPQQYYDENGNLTPMAPMRYPAGAFPLMSSFDDDTTCPNGLTFAANNSLKNTLVQMMALKNPPTSWSPPSKRPLDVHGLPHRPRHRRGR
jgi:uncharacterized protein YjbI with pentapeptide repeats